MSSSPKRPSADRTVGVSFFCALMVCVPTTAALDAAVVDGSKLPSVDSMSLRRQAQQGNATCEGIEATCIASDMGLVNDQITFEEMTQGCQCCFELAGGGDVDPFQICLLPLFPQVDFCVAPGNAQNNPNGEVFECRHGCQVGTYEEQNAAGCHGDNSGNQHPDQVCVTEGVYAPGDMQPSGESCCEWCEDLNQDGNPDYEGCCEGMRADGEMGCEDRHCEWLCEGISCHEHGEDQTTCESNGGAWVFRRSCADEIGFQAMLAQNVAEDGLPDAFAAMYWLANYAEACCTGYEVPNYEASCDNDVVLYDQIVACANVSCPDENVLISQMSDLCIGCLLNQPSGDRPGPPPIEGCLTTAQQGNATCEGIEATCIASDMGLVNDQITFEEMTQGCQCCFELAGGGDVDPFQICLLPLFPQVDFCVAPGNAQNNPNGEVFECRHGCQVGTYEEQNAAGCHGDNSGNQHPDQVCVTEGVYAPGDMQPSGESCCEWCEDLNQDGNPDYEGCCEGMRADGEMGCEDRHCEWLCEGISCHEHGEDQTTCESNGGAWVFRRSCADEIGFQAMLAQNVAEDGLPDAFAAMYWLANYAEACCTGYEVPNYEASCDNDVVLYDQIVACANVSCPDENVLISQMSDLCIGCLLNQPSGDRPGPPPIEGCLTTCTAGTADLDGDPSTPCEVCSVGQFSEAGAVSCSVCAAGTADVDEDPATSCESCAAGTFSLAGSTSCTSCLDLPRCIGTTSCTTNATIGRSCSECATGYFPDEGQEGGFCAENLCFEFSSTYADVPEGYVVENNVGTTLSSLGVVACDDGFTTVVDAEFPHPHNLDAIILEEMEALCQSEYAACNAECISSILTVPSRGLDASAAPEAVSLVACMVQMGLITAPPALISCPTNGRAFAPLSGCVDVNECLSNPCENGAVCTDSTSDDAVPANGYKCTCADGYAGGWCEYDQIVPDYVSNCSIIVSSAAAPGDGNCAIDVNECASNPCLNGGVCTETNISAWACICPGINNTRTGLRQSHDGEQCENEIDVCAYGEDDCDPYHATCHHTGPGQHDCTCHAGWEGDGHTCNDIDECLSNPCQNGICSHSVCDASAFPAGTVCSAGVGNDTRPPIGAYRCECEAGWANGICHPDWNVHGDEIVAEYFDRCNVSTGGHCDVDMNECLSNPCENGAVCTDSTSDDAVPANGYKCTCADGYAGGWCEYDQIVPDYVSNCSIIVSSAAAPGDGNCAIDVNECASNPCLNGGVCTETNISAWACICPGINNTRTGLRQSHDGEQCENEIDVCAYGEDDCDPYHATCHHTGPGQHDCTCHAGWEGDGHTCNDIDECLSNPCQNGICSHSVCDASAFPAGTVCSAGVGNDTRPPIGAYRCECEAGWANGICHPDWNVHGDEIVAEYFDRCNVSTGGHCDVDMNECLSNPCENGAVCTDSTIADKPVYSYSCACLVGFTSGECTYTLSVPAYSQQCAIASTVRATGSEGNCDVDVNECLSNPCQNDAACSDSSTDPELPTDGYRCTCVDGFTSGLCEYNMTVPGTMIVSAVRASCDIHFSSNVGVGAGEGNCEVDVDECLSNPCQNGGTCSEHGVSEWVCTCAIVENERTANTATELRVGFGGERCENEIEVCSVEEDNCDPYHATCHHTGPGQHDCTCHVGWEGDGHTCNDIDECLSNPCQNGGVCSESACPPSVFNADPALSGNNCTAGIADDSRPPPDTYRCNCAAGFANGVCDDAWDDFAEIQAQYSVSCTQMTGGSCDVDINECLSTPCQNNAACLESIASLGQEVVFDAYICVCPGGWADGTCGYNFIPEYSTECNFSSTTDAAAAGFAGTCGVDVDECISNPCENGAVCDDSTTNSTIALDTYRCTCAAGFANGVCLYDFISEYNFLCGYREGNFGWSQMYPHGGNCDIDVDECASRPCQNGATCIESSVDASISFHAYQCKCAAGYANGVCEYTGDTRERTSLPFGYIVEFMDECSVLETTQNPSLSGNCDIDVDECASEPCQNGAACSDSTVDSMIGIHAYRCSCVAGFANGACNYQGDTREHASYGFITEYFDECTVMESTENSNTVRNGTLTGNCDIDVNECASSPCQNGAACTDSTANAMLSTHAYRCACLAGYANGLCDYEFIAEFGAECNVEESGGDGTANQLSGNCDLDVDECASTPCQNGATCTESTVEAIVSIDAYQCTCTSGYANGVCEYYGDSRSRTSPPFGYIVEYFEECTVMESSSPVREDADSQLTGNCDIDVNECASEPCLNGATCTDSTANANISIHSYRCTCTAGFTNGFCEYSTIIPEYALNCSVMESNDHPDASWLSGNCDTDVNECDSNPCLGFDSVCTDSTTVRDIGIEDYSCVCAPGFIHGQCDHNDGKERCTDNCVDNYTSHCAAPYSTIPTSVTGGNCEVDVNECLSSPCQHDGNCSQIDEIEGYACACPDFAQGWEGPRFGRTLWWRETNLRKESAEKSTWLPDYDCEIRSYYDLRCEPGQQPNSTLSRGGHSDTGNCEDCPAGRYSPDGAECRECLEPDVVTPDPWWCRRRVDFEGNVIQEAGPCERRLTCRKCPQGLLPNENRTDCIDALSATLGAAAADLGSTTSNVATVEVTGDLPIRVSPAALADPALKEELTAALVEALATSMGVNIQDIIVDGLVPGRRALQDEAWRAADGYGVAATLQFTVRPGARAGAMYALEVDLQDPESAIGRELSLMGADVENFGIGQRCPEGKVRVGDETLCRKCPYPEHTVDRETCIRCPEGHEPTDKGDGCRCTTGYYNSSKGAVTCLDVFEQYTPGKVASNHEDTIGDCSPCPISLSGAHCATCVGGIIRVKAGHGVSQNLASKGLALDAIQAPRPVFLCVLGEDSCLGDAGPNETTPERGAIATTVWWENKAKCNRVVLDGRMSSCTNAGDCVYTPGIRRQERVEFVQENCTGDTDELATFCSATFLNNSTALGSIGEQGCPVHLGCTYNPVVQAAEPMSPVAERCTDRMPRYKAVTDAKVPWCKPGYLGPLCSNCDAEGSEGSGYSRGGIVRESPCIPCDKDVSMLGYVVVAAVTGAIGFAIEVWLAGGGDDEEDSRPMANRGVALVVGNGEYQEWPAIENSEHEARTMATELASFGYRVVYVANAEKDTMTKAVKQFTHAIQETSEAAQLAAAVKACDQKAQNKIMPTFEEAFQTEAFENESPGQKRKGNARKGVTTNVKSIDAPENASWTPTQQKALELALDEYHEEVESYSEEGLSRGEKKKLRELRENKWNRIASQVVGQTAESCKHRAHELASFMHNPPGLEDGEIAVMVVYCGHGCQIEGENYLVPVDCSLNPFSDGCISVDSVLSARNGDSGHARVKGPSIVILDASRKVSAGTLDKTGRDIFTCPITQSVMTDPVYLMGEPDGWRYERVAITKYLDSLKHEGLPYRSPMTGLRLVLPGSQPPQPTRKVVADAILRSRISKYIEKSTLHSMDPPVENTILVFAASPNTFADDQGLLFTSAFKKLLGSANPISMIFIKVRSLVLADSKGAQTSWECDRLDSKDFCISGCKPEVSEEDALVLEEHEELTSIMQQAHEQEQNARAARIEGAGEDGGSSNFISAFFSRFFKGIGAMMPAIRTAIGLTQVLSGMSFAFDIKFPPMFTELMSNLKVLQIDIWSILPFGCISEFTYYSTFYGQTITPPVVLVIMYIIHRIRKAHLTPQIDPPDLGIQEEHDELLASSLNICFTFVFLIYPAVSQTVFMAFLPQQVDENEIWLMADFQVNYDSLTHLALLTNAAAMVLVYPIGFPLLIFFWLFTNREELQKEDSATRVAFDPLVGAYSVENWYYEAIEMFRKIVLTGLMIFWTPGSVQQLVVGVQLSAFFLILSIKTRPFLTRFNNNFKIVTDLAVMLTFNVAILISDRVDWSMEPDFITRDGLDLMLVVVNMVIPSIVVLMELSRPEEQSQEEAKFGWLGDERHGGFKVMAEETPRLSGLRHELEGLELKTLNRNARAAGVTQKELNKVHDDDHPKSVLIDLLMKHAALEGTTRVKLACIPIPCIGSIKDAITGRKPEGTVRALFGFDAAEAELEAQREKARQRKEKEAKRDQHKRRAAEKKALQLSFDNADLHSEGEDELGDDRGSDVEQYYGDGEMEETNNPLVSDQAAASVGLEDETSV